MKSLAILALTVVATAAMAGPKHSDDPAIVISGTSVQAAVLGHSLVGNIAGPDAEAIQNVASNAGEVTVGGRSFQAVAGFGSFVGNLAFGHDAYASQNVSSNLGDVTIYQGGSSTQITGLFGSGLLNLALGEDSRAIQNVASNNACVSCQPSKGGWHDGPKGR